MTSIYHDQTNRWGLSMPMMDMLCHLGYEPTCVHWEEKLERQKDTTGKPEYVVVQAFFRGQARGPTAYMLSFPYDARRRLYDALRKRELIKVELVNKTRNSRSYHVTLTEEGRKAAQFAWWHKFQKDGGWKWVTGAEFRKLKGRMPHV